MNGKNNWSMTNKCFKSLQSKDSIWNNKKKGGSIHKTLAIASLQAWQDKNDNKDARNFRVCGVSVNELKKKKYGVWRFITTENFCFNGDEMNDYVD